MPYIIIYLQIIFIWIKCLQMIGLDGRHELPQYSLKVCLLEKKINIMRG